MKNTIKQTRMANAIRFLAVDAIEKAQSGHPGLPMGAADIATALFYNVLNHDPQKPNWPNRDRFVLSAGHGSMLLYALLYLTGYEDITLDEIKNFRQFGSKTAGHPEYGHAGGIETTTGPLGQGLANAVGMALGERLMNARFPSLIDHYVYALVGDGCLMEGLSQEAISFAGHFKLKKLIVFWDDNNISIDGAISLTDSTNQEMRFKACGWNVIKVDGHSQNQILNAIEKAKQSDRPTLIACKTQIGYGSPTKCGSNKVHGSPLGEIEISEMRKEQNWDYPPFVIPEDILDVWRLSGLNVSQKYQEWKQSLELLDPEERGLFERLMRSDLPGAYFEAIMEYKKQLSQQEEKKVATRKSSENVLSILTKFIPEMIGGSADLSGSNNTKTKECVPISFDNFQGRYIHYGIREHAMAAIMNGLSLYGGIIPYGGTFLCFSDYMRPAMRLSSLMGLRVIYVLTHDSIGLGEDGPTHQPIEHLASLRAIPNHLVMRPADCVETLECWQLALENKNRPTSLILSRQNLPLVRKEFYEDNLCALGAYELVPTDGPSMVSLFANGSEVEIALKAHELLDQEGISVRVISVPCFELFNEQPDSYRKALIGNSLVNVAIEAGCSMGWDKFLRDNDIFIGMTSFGASAPIEDLYKHFKITSEYVVEEVKKALKMKQDSNESNN